MSAMVTLLLDEQPADALVFGSPVEGAAMLEGWSDGERWRWMLPWPEETRSLSWDRATGWQELFASLESGLAIEEPVAIDGVPAPFLGGWVGFVSYEAMASEEAVVPRAGHPPEPAMFFARHRAGVVIDPKGRAFLFAPEAEIDGCRRRLEAAMRAAATAVEPRELSARGRAVTLHDSLGSGIYASAIARIREAIRDGDVYQVNLTRRLSVEGAHDAGALYRALTGTAPPRSSAFVRGNGWAIASASPEVLLRFDRVASVAETRPIKGTVKRQGDDAGEIARLLASGKDAAEHLMIVDVSRNDLGKVAQTGSVEVSEFRAVRTLANLHHLESVVRARTPGRSAASVLAALSPAASITGAPKRAAVGVIRQLEPVPRGVYCGAIGFIGSSRVELSVAIRTAVVADEGARYHAGGGIVWDSDATAEDEESFAKAAAFLDYAGVSR